jgi:hypothetical protein
MMILLVGGGGHSCRNDEADMRRHRLRDKLDNPEWRVQYTEQ